MAIGLRPEGGGVSRRDMQWAILVEPAYCGRNRLEDRSHSTWAERSAAHRTLVEVHMQKNPALDKVLEVLNHQDKTIL